MATNFQTYSKKFLDEKLSAKIDASITTSASGSSLKLDLYPLDSTITTPIHTKTVELPAMGDVSNVEYNTTTKAIKVTFTDGTSTEHKITKLASQAALSQTGGTLKLELKDIDDNVIDTQTIATVVFEEESQTLKNKTITDSTFNVDSNNTLSNITGSNFKSQATTDAGKTWVVNSSGSWELAAVGKIDSISAATDEKAISVDTSDTKNPKLSFKVATTQGEGVSLSQVTPGIGENGGLKVEVQDGKTSQKGIVQLTSTRSDSDEAQAITPKAANVTISKQETAETGYSATYVISQGGEALSPKINIPKDMVISKGEVKTCTEDDKPVAGLKVGDKYIDLTLANTDPEQHIYIPVKDLTDVYTAGNGLALDNFKFSVNLTSHGGLKFDGSTEGSKTLGVLVNGDKGISLGTDGKIALNADETTIGFNATSKVVEVLDNSISHAKLTSDSVEAANIKNGEVTVDKLATDSVTEVKLAANAVTNAKLADDAVQSENIKAGEVKTANIADDNVTEAKLATALKEELYKVAWDTTEEAGVIKFTSLA